MNKFAEMLLANAKQLNAKGQFEDAISVAVDIPKESKLVGERDKFISQVEKNIEKRDQREFDLKKAELDNQDKEAQRAHLLEMTQEKERAKTERTSIKARARAEEKYYEAVTAAYQSLGRGD